MKKTILFLTFSFHIIGFGSSAFTVLKDSLSMQQISGIFGEKNYGFTKNTLEFGNWALRETNRDTAWVKVGGAFRLNTIYTYYEGQTFPLGTELRNDWTWDTWRLNIDSYSKGLQFSFEYRFYPTFNTHFIKYGWIGYRFKDESNLQFGITQVPFGLLTYASHSWWFQTPYYVGLEDDHQIGFNYLYPLGNWMFNVAYFPLSEPRGTNETSFGELSSARYSYDVIPVEGNSNIERNQFNMRAAYKLTSGEIGVSVQKLQIYNLATENLGSQTAFAAHYEQDYGRWNLKSEVLYYNYNNVRNNDGDLLEVVQMGAYGFGSYDVASEAAMYVVGLAYNLPVDLGPVSHVQFYNDYTYTQKFSTTLINEQSMKFAPTQQNVLGALVTAGKIFAYFDIAAGYNHPWISDSFGGNALGSGRGEDFREAIGDHNPIAGNPGWNIRFNINLGYYF
ncbi:porin [Anditalea andensis]|uniref:Uncharacterized protein n=1 Tax=Anditalea andensis TaxID=1048983 RepID=A0A074L0M3_9BACT|nr:porin [Anditalea andensis]KEO74020.1 hypothetical protein EL17_07665 [Anditalea andensis]